MGRHFRNLLGQKFGKLLVIEFHSKKSNAYHWNCQCDCGTKVIVSGSNLYLGKVRSCGCYNKEKAKEQINKNRPDDFRFTYGESSLRKLYHTYCKSAEKKNRKFELSKEQFKKITQQNCYYCNKPPNKKVTGDRLYGEYIYNGIDRVDNSKGYTLENCVPCCTTCNRAKLNMTQQEFYQWIKDVYLFSFS